MSTSETATLPAPAVDLRPAVRDKWACEFAAFQRLLPQLLKTHRGEYVVIHEGRVVDRGPDDLALALRFFAEHGNVAIHVGLVTEEPEPVTRIPHYRGQFPAKTIKVVASSGEPWVLLGRDVLNAHRLVLDGPQLTFEID